MTSVFSNLHRLCVATATVLVSTTLYSQAVATPSGTPATSTTIVTSPASTGASAATPAILARGPSGLVITTADVAADMARLPEETRRIIQAKAESLQQIASNLMVRRVLALETSQSALVQTPAVVATLGLARDRVLSDARLAQMDAQNAPSDSAIENYARQVYLTNSEKFERPAQTRARHILITKTGPESLQKANALLAQLKSGASFEDLAKANSADPGSAAKGGDLGFFAAGNMVRPFDDAVNKLAKPGDLSEPVESQFGYHIIRLEDRREKGRQSFEEVRAQLVGEAKNAIVTEARLLKVQAMMKDISFDEASIGAFSKTAAP